MNIFSRLKTRIVLLVLAAFIGLAITTTINTLSVKQDLLDGRKEQVRSIVQASLRIAEAEHARAVGGEQSEEAARARALQAMQDMRYGGPDGRAEYVYVWSSTGVAVMHPFRPDWIGRNMSEEVRDAAGRYTVKDLVGAVRTARSGFVDTSFPRPGGTVAVAKLQYVERFDAWDWVVGTGVYVDDVDEAFAQRVIVDLLINGVIMLIIVGLGVVIARSVLRQIGGEPADALALMDRAAAGDLTVDVRSAPPGSMLAGLSRMLGSIREMVAQIASGAHTLQTTAVSIAEASEQVAQAAHAQADSTSSMAAAIEEMTVSINHISDSAKETEGNSSAAATLAEGGETKVRNATNEMHRIATTVSSASEKIRSLEHRVGEVSSIAGVIKEIAAQTNLLALNAAIEAARAGEQGRGFAVVADEVRSLAERTAAATVRIEEMIGGIQGDTGVAVEAMEEAIPQVEHGVELASDAAESLRDIRGGAGATLERIREVAQATHEQSSASHAIAQQVENIAQMVEETSASMHRNAESAKHLEEIATELGKLVARFRH